MALACATGSNFIKAQSNAAAGVRSIVPIIRDRCGMGRAAAALMSPDGSAANALAIAQFIEAGNLPVVGAPYRHENTRGMVARTQPSPELAAKYAEWIEIFRDHLAERDVASWAMADLVAGARLAGFGSTVTEMANALNINRLKFSNIGRIATAFPPDKRDYRVPFDVHGFLASLPDEARFEALKTAAVEGWGERKAKEVAVAYRQEKAVFVDDDPETTLAVHVMRAWNRATPEAREYFNALREVAGLGIIDEDA
jgi:hypothetical protein